MLIGIDASRAAVAQPTGTEGYSLHLIRALLASTSSHRFRLYFNQPVPPGLFPESENYESCVIPLPRLWTHLRLSLEMLLRPPDVLFVPAHVLPLVRPGRSVVTVHDLGYRHFPDAHPTADRWYLDVSTRYNARVATRVIADSHATRHDLVQEYGVPEGTVSVVYPGVTPGMARVSDGVVSEAIARHGIARPYFLYVGTLHPRKNLARLIEAFSSLPPPHVLVIAGRRGWLFEAILKRASELGIAERVIFPGYVAQRDLPALLSGATALAFPSLYEGFGLPVLEAMACGTPVVCSNTSSLPEVAGDAALLVDPLDVSAIAAALTRVASDTALAGELSRRGRLRAAGFTWERCARETLAMLEQAGGAR